MTEEVSPRAELDITEIVDIKTELLPIIEGKSKRKSLNLRHGKWVAETLEKASKSSGLTVQFTVDRVIMKGLESGEFIRKGGVIVRRDNKRVVTWLREAKLSRATKILNVSRIALDIVSEYAVTEKLKEIHREIREIKDFTEALYWDSFRDGISTFQAILKADERADHKKNLLLDARRNFENAKNRNIHLLGTKKNHIDSLRDRYPKKMFGNSRISREMLIATRDMLPLIPVIVLCHRLMAQIYEQLDDWPNAEAMRFKGLDFLAGEHNYLRSCQEEMRHYQKDLGRNCGDVLDRITRYDPTGRVIPLIKRCPDWYHRRRYDTLLKNIESQSEPETHQIEDELMYLTYEAATGY